MRDEKGKLHEFLQKAYPAVKEGSYDSVGSMLLATGDSFLFLLDEWDSVFYRKFMSPADKESYLLFLKGLLKAQPYLDLAYMTGVLPERWKKAVQSQVSIESAGARCMPEFLDGDRADE